MDECDDWLLLLSSSDFFLGNDEDPTEAPASLRSNAMAPVVPTHSSVTSLKAPPKAKVFKPLKAKRSRRVEIMLLRDQAAQLSSLHESLVNRCLQPEANHTRSGPPSDTTLAMQWKALAHRELQRREKAVEENLRLRSQLTEIAELGGRLQRQLKHQKLHLRDAEAIPSAWCLQLRLVAFHEPDPSMFLELQARLGRLYNHSRVLVDERRLQWDVTTAHVHDVQISDRSGKLDVFDARVVPFDLRATADAVWEWIVRGQSMMECPCDNIVQNGDVVQRSFAGHVVTTSTQMSCSGRIAVRRFEEHDRVVFVTTATVMTNESRTHVQHSQCIVIARPRLPAASGHAPVCTEIVCRDMSELPNQPIDTTEWSNLITTGVDEGRDRMHEFVDTKLIRMNAQ